MNALCVGGTFAGRTRSRLLSCTPLAVVPSVSPVRATVRVARVEIDGAVRLVAVLQADAAAAGVVVVGRADGVRGGIALPQVGRVRVVGRFRLIPQHLRAGIGKAAVVVRAFHRTALRDEHAAAAVEGDASDGKGLLAP